MVIFHSYVNLPEGKWYIRMFPLNDPVMTIICHTHEPYANIPEHRIPKIFVFPSIHRAWTWPKSSSHLGCNGNELPSGCSKMNFNPLETATYMSNIQRQASRFPTATKPYPQFPRGLQKSRPCVPRDLGPRYDRNR